ncbi:MAG: glutamine synthetase type III [Cytophagales bacterium]|nr:glutamine synthetase type III [Cytophagales bacterium]
MSVLRFKALEAAGSRKPVAVKAPSERISDYLGSNVFNAEAMRTRLSSSIFRRVEAAIGHGKRIDREVADEVASVMMSWAISKGVTHYTHWFQPLTGATAEKHDAFYELNGLPKPMEKFAGKELVQQEPDASSFPSGGIRNTFEARGYTAWDPTSPAFILEKNDCKTLCIPTIFVSYTGEALDYKTPMLKSLTVLDQAATSICQYFDRNVNKVVATLGPEQEYFLIDKALYNARPDLMLTGRTVLGRSSAKDQQLEDHYFGSIPSRVHAYMVDFEIEALKLGIPVRTRHNEVAPSQFECAPSFEEANLAVDHNQMLMDLMDKVAERHNFKVLLHEKPFAGINGSGKHNNWSMITNTGINLLDPGRKPKDNLRFLVFFVNTIKAIYDYADLLRASVASAGNDYRLGANEAPPAIISVFIGSQLTAVLDELEKNAKVKIDKGDNVYLKLGINKIPEILLDNTDRNRTSPFAFTGNKFEFRAVGASANNAAPMLVLNTIVANQLIEFQGQVDKQISKGTKREIAIINVLRDCIKASKKIRFEGNNYAEEWIKEAEMRGLPNIKSTPRALDAYVSEKAKKLFGKFDIFGEHELEARHEIRLENYIRKVQIESRIMGDMVFNQIIPTAISYQNKLITNVKGLKEVGVNGSHRTATLDILKKISEHIYAIKTNVEAMINARKKANKTVDTRKRAIAYCDKVVSYFETIRYHADKLEMVVDDEHWPLVKYKEMLFLR